MKKRYFLIFAFFFSYQTQANNIKSYFEKKDTSALTKKLDLTITPLFDPIGPICSLSPVTPLPTTSLNGISGTWMPSVINTMQTTTYVFTPNSGQDAIEVLMTITVIQRPQAGIDASMAVCETSTTPINLFNLLSGIPDTGGIWTRTSGTGGSFSAVAGFFTPSIGTTTSTFQYTVSGVAPCINDTSLVTINVVPQPNAGIDGSMTVCDTSTSTINLFSLISGVSNPSGIWTRTSGTGGSFSAVTGIFTPSVGTTTSTFQYTVTGVAPCLNDTSTVIITIVNQPTSIVITGNSNICYGGISQLSASYSGGTWTSSNPTIASVDNLGLVTGNAPGNAIISYTVSNLSCGLVVSTINFIIKPLLQPIVSCGVTTPNSITFNWLPVIEATTYTSYYSINNGSLIFIGPIGNVLSYTLTGLFPNNNVTFYVVPSGQVGTCFIVGSSSCTSATLDTADFNNKLVSFYPNPVQDCINFKSKIDFSKIEIFDLNSRIVKSFSKNEDKLEVQELKKGMYFAKIYSNSNTLFFKFLKE